MSDAKRTGPPSVSYPTVATMPDTQRLGLESQMEALAKGGVAVLQLDGSDIYQ